MTSFLAVLRQSWPTRRVVTALILSGGLFAAAFTRSQGHPATGSWLALATIALVVSAFALAPFVPLPRHRALLDMGCGPCAVVGGLMALASIWMVLIEPIDIGTAGVAAALSGIALVQRLNQPATCATPPPSSR